MIQFLLVGICLGVGFANALCHNLGVAFLVACVFAIFALHPSRILQEVATKSAAHDVVKLLEHEFVAIEFMNFFFPLTDGALAIEPKIKWSLILVIFRCQSLTFKV